MNALYRFALWIERPNVNAVLGFIGICAVAYLLLARDGGAI